jgi:hypothetical protein
MRLIMLKKNRLAWLMVVVAFLVLGAGSAAAEISGVYELRQQGDVRKLEVTEHRGRGSMFGLADLQGNTATYNKKDCKLTITFAGNKAVISGADAGCRDYLKPGILLDGTYIRKP